ERLQHRAWPPGRPFDVPLPEATLYENLARHAAERPDKPAILCQEQLVTYAALHQSVEQMAGYLQQICGVQPGVHIGLYGQNCPEYAMAYYAILRAQAVVVPINPMNMADEVDKIIEDAGVHVVFAASDLRHGRAAGLLRHVITLGEGAAVTEMDSAEVTSWSLAIAAGQRPAPYTGAVSDLAAMPYTSGSTGRGKGCCHSHSSIQHSARCVYDWFGFTGEDVFLAVAPMFHVVGMQCGLNTPIALGATLVILPRWDREIAANLIRDHKITVWPTVPTMVIDLLNNPSLSAAHLTSLHTIFGGGSAMPEAVAAKLLELTGLSFLEGYGMTESMGPTTANPVQAPLARCGGLPLFNTDIAIVDPDSLALLPPGEIGEVLIAGPQVMQGYWNNPEADAESFVTLEGQSFLRSGDLGRVDEQGYLFLVDRIKRMINASGYKVWPTEVESMLYRHPDIDEACVIASKDPYRGETVKAVIVLRPGASEDPKALQAWAHDHMAAYKVPRLYEFTPALPKSGTGKVLWRELQEAELRNSESETTP
ncbi:MAG: AMP-binding protein, partial [Mangrovicoccus sp.]